MKYSTASQSCECWGVVRAQHLMQVRYGEDPLAEGAPTLNDPELLMFVMEARQTIEEVSMENAETLYQHHQDMMDHVVDELRAQFDIENNQVEQTKVLIKLQYVSKMVSKMVNEIQHRKPVV